MDALVPDAVRLGRNIEELAAFGYEEGRGITRPSLSLADGEGRCYVMGLMEQAGLAVHVDPVGNIIGRRPGTDNASPAVATGSHIDTVPEGGRFDGAIGVLGAIEVVRLLNEAGVRTRHPLEVIAFTGEEQGSFRRGTKGSRAMAGKLTESDLQSWRDQDGMSYWEALAAAGYHPEALGEAVRAPGSLRCFVELHIEQGRVLEDSKHRLGIVSAMAGMTQYRLRVTGRADHSGGTPMALRRDALAGAAEVVLAVERLARSEVEFGTVGTVGDLRPSPGSTVIIPGSADLWLDCRGTDDASKARVLVGVWNALDEICRRRGLSWERELLIAEESILMSPAVISELQAACREVGVEPLVMPSGANHDTRHMAALAPVGMLFVPSVGGVSHAPDEYTAIEDICMGVQVLARALVRLAGPA